MDRIYINLSPKKEKLDNAILQQVSYYMLIGVFFVLCLIALLAVFLFIRIAVTKHYESRWSRWKGQSSALSVIKNELSSLQNEKSEFTKILTPQTQMAKIFSDIFSSLPQNIWFNSLNFNKKSLNINGHVVRSDSEDYLVSLENFINSLKTKEYFASHFKNINIKDSQKNDFNGIEVLEFNLECSN
jgi:Tfp pilus assembly protein PilN